MTAVLRWTAVLENGASSRYASFFDIDWQPYEERLRNKVLVPVLADQYGKVLQAGGIKVVRHGTNFQVECAGQCLPASPASLSVTNTRPALFAQRPRGRVNPVRVPTNEPSG